MTGARTPGTIGGTVRVRACATVAAASVVAHLWMAWAHRSMPWESALMVLMAAACLPCAVAVWRRGHDRAVQLLFAMALVMVAVHTTLLLAPGAMAGQQHGGMGSMGMDSMGMAANAPASHTGAMLGVIALELVVAALAAWAMRSARSCPRSA
ncbi:hypothetical protein AL755_13935 [Arthrobacter sp. ERGS1:01]|nr:hypothetical protein AL755_13935 [Arthrobacter sp. ERGS1:01]